MRIAWFSPLPPHRSGIAAYSAELLPRLRHHEIDAFVDDGTGAAGAAAVTPIPGMRIRGAHDFPWRQAVQPYDVVVYQLGNDACHEYMWPYLVRYPGLVVLHDAQLHQSRAQGLIGRGRETDYRAEFGYCHPEAPPGIADLIISGLGGTLYYVWPMTRVAVEAARLMVVHNAVLGRDLNSSNPGQAIRHVRQGVADLITAARATPAEVRRRHALPDDAILFGSFGRVTAQKGLTPVLRALAIIAPSMPAVRLLIVGDTPAYFDVAAQAEELGVADRVVITGYLDEDALPEYLAAVDVSLNLRWPTARETSAAWLRCLAAGKPTIITDLAHQTDIPSLDPRTRRPIFAMPPAGGPSDPICLIVGLDDEVNMLRLGMAWLGGDAALRTRLGQAARRYWETHATLACMAEDYEAALALASREPPTIHARWPAHLTEDGTGLARHLAASVGVPLAWLHATHP